MAGMIRFLVTRNGSVGQETIAFAFYAHEAEDFSPFSFSIFSFSSHNVSHSFKIYETVLSEKNTFIISFTSESMEGMSMRMRIMSKSIG